ncbi:NPC intracellular cholesterol transporter 2 homolog a-like [Ptychodera flava]|uniref:NPC intracellular cholesterol transporter 2 homolog a-like n=1 Tax=Ptychodera flava TaxID=63121 RepID=UPI003969F7EB
MAWSAVGKIKSVDVDPCPQEPCVLKKGTNVTVHIDFTAGENITAVKASVHGIIAEVPIPFPLKNPDGCKDSGLKCPLEAGKEFVYFSTIQVLQSYPAIKLVIKWELVDQNGKDIACLEVPAQIQ